MVCGELAQNLFGGGVSMGYHMGREAIKPDWVIGSDGDTVYIEDKEEAERKARRAALTRLDEEARQVRLAAQKIPDKPIPIKGRLTPNPNEPFGRQLITAVANHMGVSSSEVVSIFLTLS